MKIKIAVLSSLSLLALSACNVRETTETDVAWTQAEINQVFDLKELGEVERRKDGTIVLGDKILDPSYVSSQSYGKDYNLLDLSDDVLNALPIEVRDALELANADELRLTLAHYGLSMSDIADLKSDGVIGLDDFKGLARQAATNTNLSTQSNDQLLQSVIEALDIDLSEGKE